MTYEEATRRGHCLVCLGSVVAGEYVTHTVYGVIHKECDERAHGILAGWK